MRRIPAFRQGRRARCLLPDLLPTRLRGAVTGRIFSHTTEAVEILDFLSAGGNAVSDHGLE
jgi:hypothetical protein